MRQWREANPEKVKEAGRRTRQKCAEQRREYNRGYRKAHPEQNREKTRRYREAHPEKARTAVANYRASLRRAVFDHYGWTCTCCGSAKSPTIDHVEGGGAAHRLELSGRGDGGESLRIYRWLIDNEFPVGFQTLCRRCNASKLTFAACRINHRSTVVEAA